MPFLAANLEKPQLQIDAHLTRKLDLRFQSKLESKYTNKLIQLEKHKEGNQ